MTNSSIGLSSLMLLAGIGIPIMAAINSDLGARINNPVAAAFILFLVGLAASGIVLAFVGLPSPALITTVPVHYFLGGLFVAFYVLSITWAAPNIGVGNAIFLVLLGQLVSAAAIDHFGILGATVTPITLQRAAGLLIMASGIRLALE